MSSGRVRERLTTLLGIDPEALSRIGLASAVRRRMHALDLEDEDAYADRIDVDMAEFERLAMAVMVHETSFFRYPASFELLVSEVDAGLEARQGGPFRIHCVASSTGEEPSSIAMALLDAGTDMSRVQIDATDVSERAIEYARRGSYRLRGVQRLPDVLRERWFKHDGDTYELTSRVRDCITYERANALDPVFGLGRVPYDAILCRNLLIYLVPEARRRLLRRLREMLNPGGLLFVGHAEVGAVRDEGLELVSPPEAFACRLAARRTRAPAPGSRPRAGRPPRRPLPPAPPAAPAPDEVLRRAASLADAGDLEQAHRALIDGIAGGPASADHYHLLALVESARRRDEESEEALRRALYLDPHHYPSLMQLALLAETRGERGRARRLRAKAARVKGDGHDA